MVRYALLSISVLLSCTDDLSAQFPPQPQHRLLSASALNRVPLTMVGGPVNCRFADPFASNQQIAAIKQLLNEPYGFDWGASTTCRDIARDLSSQVSIEVDHAALEEIGVNADEPIYPELDPAKPKPKPDPRHDPFAAARNDPKTLTSAKSDQNLESPDKPATISRKWWRSGSKRGTVDIQSVTNAARLFYFLDGCDLILNMHHGQLVITTLEAAEQNQCVSIFDVTPLGVPDESVGEPMSHVSYGYVMDDPLVETIQISITPDTWEQLGGPSTIRRIEVHNRQYLVVTSPLMTAWKIETLLTRLNE